MIAVADPTPPMSTSAELARDAAAANTVINFLAKRDVSQPISRKVDLCVVCGSSILATV